jgi:hypothetical protein
LRTEAGDSGTLSSARCCANHRLAGVEIALDDLTEDVARALVELGEPGIRRAQADRIAMAMSPLAIAA